MGAGVLKRETLSFDPIICNILQNMGMGGGNQVVFFTRACVDQLPTTEETPLFRPEFKLVFSHYVGSQLQTESAPAVDNCDNCDVTRCTTD